MDVSYITTTLLFLNVIIWRLIFSKDFESLATCQCINFNMSGGIFQSPNYPIIFSDEKCFIYQFIAPTNYIVQTIFSFFNLSPRRNDR